MTRIWSQPYDENGYDYCKTCFQGASSAYPVRIAFDYSSAVRLLSKNSISDPVADV